MVKIFGKKLKTNRKKSIDQLIRIAFDEDEDDEENLVGH